MSKRLASVVFFLFLGTGAALLAQAPTGLITGVVSDESGAVIPNATVTITEKATGVSRVVTTNAEGLYSAPALPAAEYTVRAEAQGFKTSVRDALVTVGGNTQVNMPMSIGTNAETVTVEAATAQINYESHSVEGVIPRATIQDLPLNGRSYLQLAELEPGVTISAGSVAQFNALFTVSVLGAGNRTVVTVDGGNVSDNIDVGGGMASMNLSQEVVQEFQLSEVNFDLATPIAAGGALNVVTRSGSNDWHGSAYFFYRDHNMAAYPNLQRLPGQSSPFFVRRNPGASLGGPIKKDKVFFFFNYEFLNQVQALGIQTTDPAFAPLENNYGSPYTSKTISARIDYHLNAKNNMFIRYSHDGNSGFGQSLEYGDPSNWAHNTNWADQGIIGLTTLFSATIVNDLRFQYNYWNNHNDQAVSSDCSAPCVAGSLPNVYTFEGGNFPAVGPNFNAPQARNTRRYEIIEAFSWQKGSHRLKFGADTNPTNSAGLWGFCTPMCVGAFSPTFLQNQFGAAYSLLGPALFPTVPSKLTSDAQILDLPVLNIGASIFSGIGVGSVSTPAAYNYNQNRGFNQYRAYFQDVWKVTQNLTLNYGLAWNAQSGFYNSGVPKPEYLSPILGSALGQTQNNNKEFQPAFGFAWSPFHDNKTVIRGGGGIYWDSTPGYYKLREAASIDPPGSSRNTLAASAFTNEIPGPFGGSGLVAIGAGSNCPISPLLPCTVIPEGAPLPLNALTNMTVGQFIQLVNAELPTVESILSPSNPIRSGPFPYANINYAKQGVEIYPEHFPLARSYQTSLGVQRDLGHDLVLTADWARRQGENVAVSNTGTTTSETDYNLYSRYQGSTTPVPVIPLCKTSPDFIPTDECSSGAITFWTDEGRAIYNGLLVKVQKRMSHRYQYLVSYALQRGTDTSIWDDLNWFSGQGQYLAHQNLTIAGTVNLPWGFTISMNSSMITRTPVTATVPNLDLAGTAPSGSSEPLPGLAFGCLNAGCGQGSLTNAVQSYNSKIAGTLNAQGAANPYVVLPQNYGLGSPTITQDFRLTKTFTVKERYRFNILAEMFNAFNVSNLSGYSYSLQTSTTPTTVCNGCSFGQATQRAGQTFGSAGPRAVQLGGRFTF